MGFFRHESASKDKNTSNIDMHESGLTQGELETMVANILANPRELESLDLSGNDLTDAAITCLSQIRVKKLNLSDNNLTNAAVKELLEKAKMPYETLDVRRNNLKLTLSEVEIFKAVKPAETELKILEGNRIVDDSKQDELLILLTDNRVGEGSLLGL